MFGPDLERQDLAYPRLVAEVLPKPLVGFFGAVIFGAILSSFNSVLHSASTLFGLDIYRAWINTKATDEETVRVGKTFGIGLALVAMSLAPFIGKAPGMFDLMKRLAAVTDIPILAVVIMGLITTRVSTRAAKISLPAGMAFIIVFSLIGGNRIAGYELHWLHFAGLSFVVMCLLMLVLTRLFPDDEKHRTNPIKPDTANAWRIAKAVSFVVVVFVFLIYTFLHTISSMAAG